MAKRVGANRNRLLAEARSRKHVRFRSHLARTVRTGLLAASIGSAGVWVGPKAIAWAHRSPLFTLRLIEVDYEVLWVIRRAIKTSEGRKGTAFDTAAAVFKQALPTWETLVHKGLSTGEGLILKVADPQVKTDKQGQIQIVQDGGLYDGDAPGYPSETGLKCMHGR